MLLLLFSTSKERYAMNCDSITEIIPYLNLQPIPMTPPYIVGAANYRGEAVPIIDLSQLLDGTQCEPLFSTRIILIQYVIDSLGEKKTIGLLAEKVTETIRTPKGWSPELKKDSSNFIPSSIINQEMVQWFEPEQMLPKNISQSMFMEYSEEQEQL